ncbi:MAG: hypothetical protein IPK15_13745 [Verrucomicrobia bacterium]|nr:hypothetical protein [Verrucomicrobiota bacterium]
MQSSFPKQVILFIAAASIGMSSLMAQTFSVLHSFDGTSGGRSPQAGLVASGNILYGAADSGGAGRRGTFFKLNMDGTGFATLHHFAPLLNETNSDGAYPDSTPVLSGNTIFGTAYDGGIYGHGTVFKMNTTGSDFSVLHHFKPIVPNGSGASTNAEGADAEAGLVVADNFVYGTTENGGTSGLGAVFRVGANGNGFTNLHSFTAAEGDTPEPLVMAGNKLYGTAAGLKSGSGSVFRLNTDGTGFTILHTFVATNYAPPLEGPGFEPAYTNVDGVLPASLLVSGSTIYGTTYWGGANGNGTVYRMQLDGSGFSVLHHFGATRANLSGVFTNSGGAHPIQFSGLTLWGKTLFGTTFMGGKSGNGTVFALLTNGTGFTILHDFSPTSGPSSINSDGATPYSGLMISNDTIFGTARSGGASGSGTVFSIAIVPRLSITQAGESVILTWPQNAIGFTLESTTNLNPPVTWSTVTPAPVVVNGFNTVINPASAAERFYRLSQ